MVRRRPSDTENKLLLLYALNRLGAVTAQQLLLFMVENKSLDYVSIQLGLAELVDAALLRKKKHEVGLLYVLTQRGRESLALFENRVPYSRRAAVDAEAEAWRKRFRKEKQMLADFEKAEGGGYTVHLRLLEWDSDLLDMRLSVPTHKQAQHFCDAWIAQAPGIYGHIMRALGEGDTEAAP